MCQNPCARLAAHSATRDRAGERGRAGVYDRLVDALLEAGLTPWLCFYHWDLPQALQDRGGWQNRDIADWFRDYAMAVHRRLGDRVRRYATFNEPNVLTILRPVGSIPIRPFAGKLSEIVANRLLVLFKIASRLE